MGLVLRQLAHPQRGKGHILQRSHMGEEVKPLENHAYVFPDFADICLGIGDLGAVYVNGAAGGFFEEVKAAQEGALTRAARADDDNHLSLAMLQVMPLRTQAAEVLCRYGSQTSTLNLLSM